MGGAQIILLNISFLTVYGTIEIFLIDINIFHKIFKWVSKKFLEKCKETQAKNYSKIEANFAPSVPYTGLV